MKVHLLAKNYLKVVYRKIFIVLSFLTAQPLYQVHYQVFDFDTFDESQYAFAYEPFLFNQQAHAALQPSQRKYVLVGIQKGKIQARINLFVEDKVAYSPFLGTFGFIECSEQLPYEALYEFVDALENFCHTEALAVIELKMYPAIYTSMSPLLSHILWQKHYQVVTSELNQHWYLSQPLPLHISAQRRLRKCEQAGFQFARWEQPDLSEVYQFVKAARERKKFPISLSQESFEILFERFPRQHQVFTVRDKEKIIALTVTIAVNSKILYNFYPADHEDYLNFSPMVMLMQGIKAYATGQHYELLDLGVSTEKGTPNFGLLRFKQNLGSSLSLKLTYNKHFS